jgi:hypothetical protein
MSGAIPPLPKYAFMAWCLIKHRGNFTFTLPLLFLCSFSFFLPISFGFYLCEHGYYLHIISCVHSLLNSATSCQDKTARSTDVCSTTTGSDSCFRQSKVQVKLSQCLSKHHVMKKYG